MAEKLLGAVNRAGSVSKQTALELFASEIAPLPGVRVPHGTPGYVQDATLALSTVLAHLHQLSPAQRAKVLATIHRLVAGRVRVSTARTAWTASVIDQANALARRFVGDFERVMGPLDEKVYVASGVRFDSAYAAAVPLDRVFVPNPLAPVSNCVIFLNRLRPASGDDLAQAMAHEVFHCFQAHLAGNIGRFDAEAQRSAWLIEGGANYAACTVQPKGTIMGSWLQAYALSPGRGLFHRTYDAIGFFYHLAFAHIDPFGRMRTMLADGGFAPNEKLYQDAVTSDEEASVLGSSSSVLFHDLSLGEGWSQIDNCDNSAAAAPKTSISVAKGQTQERSVDPLANGLYKLDANRNTDAVTITATRGYVRVGGMGTGGQVNDVLGGSGPHEKTYCLKSDDLKRTPVPDLALTGDLTGGEIKITGGECSAPVDNVHVVIEGGAQGSEADQDGHTRSISMQWHEEADGMIKPADVSGASQGLIPFNDDTTKDSLTGNADDSQLDCHGPLTTVPHGLFSPNVQLDHAPPSSDPNAPGFLRHGALTWLLPIHYGYWATPQNMNCGGTANFYFGGGSASVLPSTPVDLGSLGTTTYSNSGTIPVVGTGSLAWQLKITITVTPAT